MKRTPFKSAAVISLILALCIMTAACGKTPEPVPSEPDILSSQSEPEKDVKPVFINTLREPVFNSEFPKLTAIVAEKAALNDDTIGWLRVPNTTIDDVVLYRDDRDTSKYEGPNKYYERRGFDRKYSYTGVYYADCRQGFGDGSRGDLPKNTVIYGHTISEDINGVKLANLKYFVDEKFARDNPYIYFSTLKEDLVWEVFAVFYATVELPYNIPNLPDDEFGNMLSECIKRSIYTYDTQVSASDKVITLSTCTYSVPGIGKVGYPSKYRYVIMAKLVDKSQASLEQANFEVNPSPKAP